VKYAQAETHPGAWKLPANDVWNIPPGSEQRFDMECVGPWQIVSKIRGLAIDLDGRVYGMRSMSRPRQSGYEMEGYVSIGSKKRSAFTSSMLFEREDGSLVSVACLIVRREKEANAD